MPFRIETDVKKRHDEKAAKKAAAELPVGFISEDVMKRHEVPSSPPSKQVKPKAKPYVPVGFIAEDVKHRHQQHLA